VIDPSSRERTSIDVIKKETMMAAEQGKTEQNKTTVRRFIEEVFNKGNLNLLNQLVDNNYVGRDPSQPNEVRGPEGLKKNLQELRTAFPDLTLKIEDIFCEGDKVCCRWTGSGTHKGEYLGLSPTNKKASMVVGLEVFRLSNGKIVEDWNVWDTMGWMKQIGVTPEVEAAY
jgi:steroid delta-isomerase-like uncharacterized protein